MTTGRLVLRALVVLGLGGPLAPPVQAQVGHDPASSPYEDLRGR